MFSLYCENLVIQLIQISILEYFQFRFYEISSEEKRKWAGTGYMYEYQLLMNPKESRNLLSISVFSEGVWSVCETCLR